MLGGTWEAPPATQAPTSPRRRDGNPVAEALPSELRWQSGRLLTDRS